MTLFELHHTMDRQATILNEVSRNDLVSEYRKGHPNLGQRMIVTAGEALENAGGWLKRRGGNHGYVEMNAGLPVPR